MKTLSLLDGVFSFILVDRDILYIARDPIGVRPLFFGQNNESTDIGFCSVVSGLCGLLDNIDVFPPGPWTSSVSAPILADKSRNGSSLELFWGSILVFLRNPVGKRENDLIAIPD